MAYKLVFSETAISTLDALPRPIAQRIIKKVTFYSSTEQPLNFAKSLSGGLAGDYRFRVGDYRIIFSISHTTIAVSAIGHRRDVYKI